MGFKKAKAPQTESNIDWKEFNEHVHDTIQGVIDEEGGNLVCFVSALIDSGTQPPQDEFREYEYEGTDQQEKLIKLGVAHVEDDKIFVKNRDVDSVIMAVDFPNLMINYGKFFSEDGEDDFKPYRHLLAGEWMGVAGYSTMTPAKDGYSPLSMISKVAKATGAYKKSGKVDKDFDIGELLGKPFTMDVEVSMGGDEDQYLNFKATNPSKKHKAIPVPEHDVEPIAILMDGGNEEEDLKQIRGSVIKRLEMAAEWEKSGLKEELEKAGKLGSSSSSGSSSSKPSTSKKKVEQEPDEEPDDDDNPFAEDDD